MRFGVFYELQLPRPWNEGDEASAVPPGAGPGRARRPAWLRLRLGSRAPLPRGIFAFLGAGSFPRRRAALTKTIRLGHGIRQVIPNYNHPARTAGVPGDARHHLRRPGRFRHRRRRDAARARRLQDPGQGEARDGARGRRADRQHDGAGALSRLRGQVLLDAVPQRPAQAGAEAASADVDGLHQPRHHQGRGAERASARWPSPSSIRRRRGTGPRSITASSSRTSACRSAMR